MFSSKTDVVKGVNDVSLTIHAGEAVGLVGESGSGKTTFGQTVLRLQGKTGGEVLFKGHDLFKLPQRELRTIRPQMQYIFQDPYSALNPRMTIGRAIGDEGGRERQGRADAGDLRHGRGRDGPLPA